MWGHVDLLYIVKDMTNPLETWDQQSYALHLLYSHSNFTAYAYYVLVK